MDLTRDELVMISCALRNSLESGRSMTDAQFHELMGGSRDQAEHLVSKAASYLNLERRQMDAERWANTVSAFGRFEQLVRGAGDGPDREEEISALRCIVVSAMRGGFPVDPTLRP